MSQAYAIRKISRMGWLTEVLATTSLQRICSVSLANLAPSGKFARVSPTILRERPSLCTRTSWMPSRHATS
ncbi:hypothetical protein VTN96DRAFT_588 [Rasamsonia emersonii]